LDENTSTIKVKQGLKIPAFKAYDFLLEFDELLSVVSAENLELTDMQMAKVLFSKLDTLAETVSRLSLSKSSSSHLLIRRISVSPTKKFQLWAIKDKVIIFSESFIWLAIKSVLFLEGELSITKNIVWDEEKQNVSMTLFYIVSDEYEDLKVSYFNYAAGGFIQMPVGAYADKSEGEEQELNTSPLDTMMAYSEVWAIINMLEDSVADRIPFKVKHFFEEERLKEYKPQIDATRPLTEQDLKRKTLAILALLNVNYWCNNEKERDFYLREMAKNDNKPFDKEDTSWDLERIFGEDEQTDCTKDVVELPVKREEDNHVTVHMPCGKARLFVNNVFKAPMSQFRRDASQQEDKTALEIRLWNNWGAALDVKNINLENIYIPRILSPGEVFAVFDGMYVWQKASEALKINASYNEDGILCIRNDSKCDIRILKSLRNGERVSLSDDEVLVNQEGEAILSFSNLEGWICEEWDPDNEW